MRMKTIKMLREVLQWAVIVAFIATVIALELSRAATAPAELIGLKERCDSLEIELLQMKNENKMMAVNPYYFDNYGQAAGH